MKTPLEVRDEIIKRAMASVEKHETREFRRKGCLKGLEFCKTLETNSDFLKIFDYYSKILEEYFSKKESEFASEDYWEIRCAQSQIEHIYERMKILWNLPKPWSARAYLQVAEILGIKPDDIDLSISEPLLE